MVKKREVLTEIIFWLHLPIVILLFGLFFVPSSIWPGKITFHFWFFISIILIEFIWGLFYYPITKKIDIICPLTTLMQSLRGFYYKNKKNYGYSYNAELLSRLGIKISYKMVNIILIICLILVTLQYFF